MANHEILPARFRESTLDGYQASTPSAKSALRACRRLAAGVMPSAPERFLSLVLSGATGVGKTHLAAGVVNDVLADNQRRRDEAEAKGERPVVAHTPRWVNVADVIVQLRLEIGERERPWTWGVSDMHARPGLLVLDDLGREKASDWTAEVVYAVVNARYEALLPTLVTTNLTGAELAASPYWPAVSRLAEDGELVRIEAPDRRLAR